MRREFRTRWRAVGRRAATIVTRRGDGRGSSSGWLRPAASLLPAGDDRRVVVLADAALGRDLAPVLAEFAHDRVAVVAQEADPDWPLTEHGVEFVEAGSTRGAHEALKRLGPVDVLLNLRTADDERHLKMWQSLFFHLRGGGCYLVDRRRVLPSDEPGLMATLQKLAPHVGAHDQLRALPQRRRERARSTGAVLVTPDLLAVGKRGRHLLKVRDKKQTTRLLGQRVEGLAVTPVATRPGGTLVAGGSLTLHGNTREHGGFDRTITYPPLYLRRYEGRVALARGGVVVADHTVFPDTFRWHQASNPINRRLINVDADWARLRPQHWPVRELPGSYYYLDYSNSGHFGHLMTEAMAKFWGWHAAKAADPSLKLLLRVSKRDPNRPEPRLETRLLEAFGVPRSDMVWVDESVWVESLVGASPMWHNTAPYYAHPEITDVWDRIREGLGNPDGPRHSRIFITRPGTEKNRPCRNTPAVEELFARHGFEIIHPARLDIGDQISLFHHADVIAGFGGSGLFNLGHARPGATLVVLSQEAYDSRSEYLYAAVRGLETHYFYSAPDLAQPEDGWSYKAFQSGWEFDFDRNGAELTALLGSA